MNCFVLQSFLDFLFMSPLGELFLSAYSDKYIIMELRETEKRLLEAVSYIIKEEGFAKIGVNRIAKQAKCDKVLMYRYFGGLDGLLAAWAREHDFYTFAYTDFRTKIQQATPSTIKEITKEILIGQLEYLRSNPLMQELFLWELSDSFSFRAIQSERENNGHKLQIELEQKLGLNSAESCIYITILIAAINYIVLFTRQYNKFNGIDFTTPRAWDVLRGAISNYIDVLFNSILK